MKLILLDRVENLGASGDVVNVKDGFGRNFLLPRKKAMLFTEKSLQFIEKKKKSDQERYKKDVEKWHVVANKIRSTSCEVAVQAGEDGHLYGSVTSQDIQEVLAAKGITIEKKQVVMDDSIKELGDYTVTVRLVPEVDAELKISVVRSS